MSALRRTLGAGAALALLLSLWSPAARAVEGKLPQNPDELIGAMAEYGKPGAEHAKLNPLVGTWSYTCKFWLDPSKPPVETTGTIERKWMLGNRFLVEKVRGTGFDGKPGFEGFGLLGYDNAQKQYTSTWACSMGTGKCTGVGVADDSGKRFTFHTESYCPIRKKVVKGREEFRIENPDTVVMESYELDNGKETKIIELVSVRQK